MNRLKRKDVKEWSNSEIKIVVEAILNQFRQKLAPIHLKTELWRSVSDKKVVKLCPIDQSKVVTE